MGCMGFIAHCSRLHGNDCTLSVKFFTGICINVSEINDISVPDVATHKTDAPIM